MRHMLSHAAFLAAAVFGLHSNLCQAQNAATGAVLGTVTDPSGAVVGSAQIELRNAETGVKASVVSSAQGTYAFPNLAPGKYSATARVSGFRTTVINDVTVQVNSSTTVNFNMEVGEVTSTVEVTGSAAQVDLQRADSTVGDTISTQPLLRLPTRLRQAQELLLLQPGTTPQTGGDSGGSIAGALNDQTTFTLDGIDITDNNTNSTINSDQGARPTLMVSVESTDEFRVATANPNATFTRGSGGQVSLMQRSGTNELHGSLFWYTQNSVLNANSWDNNRLGLAKPHVEDNRGGGRIGGPIIKNRTFFFAEYETRRYPETFQVNYIVPTTTLRQGILRFKDSAGNINSFDLASSSVCGASGNTACDPRGLGVSPTMKAMMALDPLGNNPNVSGVDNLNTTGFTANVQSPLSDDFGTLRLDHNITDKLHFNGSFSYSRDLAYDPSPLVVDIRNPSGVQNQDFTPSWTSAAIAGLTYMLSPHVVNTFRFGDVRNRNGGLRPQLSAIAAELDLPGTNSPAGYVAVTPNVFAPPISMSNSVRTQFNNDVNTQFVDDLSWTKGTHLIQAGGNFQRMPMFHLHSGKVGGAVNSLNATTTADSSFLVIPAADRPPACGGSLTTQCLPSSQTSTWDSLYATVLGLMNDNNTLLVRNSQLQPQPFGTFIDMNALSYYTSFYGQDTWRIRPSLTLTYGLSYSFQSPQNFGNREETMLIDTSTGQPISGKAYLQAKLAAALQGQIYNPPLGFEPVTQLHRSGPYNTDFGDVAPRVALAWSPRYSKGALGKILGANKTVLRGGFGIFYNRLSGEDSVVSAGLNAGFSSTITTALTACNASGVGGTGCNATATANPALSSFRIGVDGAIPTPTYPQSITTPYIPAGNYSELYAPGIDPAINNSRIYTADFTIQRNLGRGIFLEAAWIGRYGRGLYSYSQLNASPYMFKDSASGQTFAQAYDAVANALRAGQAVAVQPFFENQLPGLGAKNGFTSSTAFLANKDASYFTLGSTSSLFDSTSSSQPGLNALRGQLGLQQYDETQVNELAQVMNTGWSNYNALVLTLRHTGTNFTFDVNYTYSKSLDTDQGVQNDSTTLGNPLEPSVDYGPSKFDHRHIFNALFVYNLPRSYHGLPAALNYVTGGWYISGIMTALSGSPLYVNESSAVWGGGQRSLLTIPAVPLVAPASLNPGMHSNIAGSGNIGTNGNPASGGTGLNLFANPQAAYSDFGYVQLSQNIDGYGHPLYGLHFWNTDASVGKRFPIRERVNLGVSFDFYNLFNHANFNNPSLPLTGSSVANFGVISSTVVPANRQASSRWIMFGARLEF
ncbi:MAG TPA: carboxypeptidase-like regulatory domain-containing protein [Bryobacteraceae bacterium]|nr:carboxypeptidase-like regulatory domain-containing protein [Bryobacteraceae bacterium]